METQRNLEGWPARVAPFVPLLAVAIGLHVLGNAWLSVLLNKFGVFTIFLVDHRRVPFARTLRGWHAAWVTGGIAFGAAGGALLLALWPLLDLDPVLRTELAALELQGASWIAFIAYVALLNPWIEELFWRGYLASTARGPHWKDLMFAGYHMLVLARFLDWPWLLLALATLTGAAWFWRMLTARTHGLLPAVLSHVAGTGSIMLVAYLKVLR